MEIRHKLYEQKAIEISREMIDADLFFGKDYMNSLWMKEWLHNEPEELSIERDSIIVHEVARISPKHSEYACGWRYMKNHGNRKEYFDMTWSPKL